jgi:hypothetical protein
VTTVIVKNWKGPTPWNVEGGICRLGDTCQMARQRTANSVLGNSRPCPLRDLASTRLPQDCKRNPDRAGLAAVLLRTEAGHCVQCTEQCCLPECCLTYSSTASRPASQVPHTTARDLGVSSGAQPDVTLSSMVTSATHVPRGITLAKVEQHFRWEGGGHAISLSRQMTR